MKIYLVKRAMLETSERGMEIARYNGIEDDYHFSSKKKAYSFIKEFVDNQEEWEHNIFPFETWTKKQEFYQHKDKKWFSKIELHEIDVD